MQRSFWILLLFLFSCTWFESDQGNGDLIGLKVPDIVGTTMNNKSASLRDIKSKYVVLHLMDVDCHYCLNTINDLNDVVRNAKTDHDIEVFSVGVGLSYSEWMNSVSKNPINGTCVYLMGDKSGLIDTLGVSSLPSIYILSKDRKIEGGPFSDPLQLEETLQDLLK